MWIATMRKTINSKLFNSTSMKNKSSQFDIKCIAWVLSSTESTLLGQILHKNPTTSTDSTLLWEMLQTLQQLNPNTINFKPSKRALYSFHKKISNRS